MLERIKSNFTESIQTKIAATETMPEYMAKAAQLMAMSLINGNKLLVCGNGGSAALAQHFSSLMLNRFQTERPSLPAVALTADTVTLSSVANDYLFEDVFAKQVRAIGQPGDILVALSTSGNSANIVKALEAAVTRDMLIIALTGGDGGVMSGLLGEQDVELRAPTYQSIRSHEVHLLTLHCLADLIDETLFPSQPEPMR